MKGRHAILVSLEPRSNWSIHRRYRSRLMAFLAAWRLSRHDKYHAIEVAVFREENILQPLAVAYLKPYPGK